VYYAKLDPKRPNKRFDKDNPTWEVQLRTEDKEQRKAWEGMGLPVKAVVPDEGPPYWRLNLKKKIKKADGTDSSPVEVIDYKLNPVDPRIIGNGSIANIRIFQYDKKDGSGKVAVLMGIQLIKLIKFTPKNIDDEFGETDGEETVDAQAGADADDGGFKDGAVPPGTASLSPSPSPSPSPTPKPASAF